MVTKTRCQHRNVTDADIFVSDGEPTHECEDCGKCLCNLPSGEPSISRKDGSGNGRQWKDEG